ncbi:MAG: hypothetical protein U5N86_09425 [Planctomycetota bacterium]|nr:hypothetical protein [Planctomycetota bacterium]
MFRLVFSVYFGKPEEEHSPHESPPNMTVPLVVLSLLSIGAGYAAHYFVNRLGGEVPHVEHGGLTVLLTSIIFGLGGILLAWAIYSREVVKPSTLDKAFGPLSTYLHRKWYCDEIYDHTVLALVRTATSVVKGIDRLVIDDAAHMLGRFSRWLGFVFRQMHSGSVQVYVFTMAIALLVLIFIFNLIRFS